ncbi:MAG: hypothetical protein ACYCUM_03585 [Solirubrobacteraceae bacterium]
MAGLPYDQGAMTSFLDRVRAGCAGALRGTPAEHLEEDLQVARRRKEPITSERAQLEVVQFLTTIEDGFAQVQFRPQMAAARRFVGQVQSIRWGDQRITALIRAFVAVQAQMRRPPPNVCAEIKRWAESHYRKVAANVNSETPHGKVARAWARALLAVGCSKFASPSERTVLAILRRYQRPGEQPTTREIEEAEFRLGLGAVRARRDETLALFRTLGLSIHQANQSVVPPHALKVPPPTDCGR